MNEERKSKKILWIIIGILIGIILVLIVYFVYQKFIIFRPKPIYYQKPLQPPQARIENGYFTGEKLVTPQNQMLGIFNADPYTYTLSSPDCPHLNGISVVPLGFTPIMPGTAKKCTVYIKEKPEKPIIFEFK